MKITDKQIEESYRIAKRVFERQITPTQGAELLQMKFGMNVVSARIYISNFARMIEGKKFSRSMSAYAADYYIKQIANDYGVEALDRALSSVLAHIEDYESSRKITLRKLRSVVHDVAKVHDRKIVLPLLVFPRANMELIKLLNQYKERIDSDGGRWNALVDYIDCIHAELDKITSADVGVGQLKEAESVLTNFMMNSQGNLSLFGRVIAAELLGILTQDVDKLVSVVMQGATVRKDDDNIVFASLAANLTCTIDLPVKINETLGANKTRAAKEILNLINWKALSTTFSDTSSFSLPDTLPRLQSIKTIKKLRPGDCLFRRQSGSWFGNPVRDFGHAGLYIGCINPELDASDCSNHMVIHVVSDNPACQMTSLREFCNPDGEAEEFWGAYQIDLSDSERNRLIQTAFSYVNKCVYSFTTGYKNSSGQSFRCDGFVEHCYETTLNGSTIQPWSYREGLFEKDTWKTMSPTSLRNCLTRKVLFGISGCCDPND